MIGPKQYKKEGSKYKKGPRHSAPKGLSEKGLRCNRLIFPKNNRSLEHWDFLLIPGGRSISSRYSMDPPGPLPPVGRVGRQQQQQQVAGETKPHTATAPVRSFLAMVWK